MPLLTFVLVVHGEQGYLEECVSSILGQPETDVELIAIDDASPDHGPALLDQLAERDARMTVTHLDQRLGPAARNLGLERAGGEYVWFVDATDRLPPGALAQVAEELRGTRPDVLVVHHAELQTVGRERQGPHRKALGRAAEQGPGPLAERRALAQAAPHAWNKVLRRELLEDAGARFGAGHHSELTVTWPALLAAERITAVPVKSYERRRPANATPNPGSPFDVFDQYERVLTAAGERTDLVRPAMRRHLLKLLERVPADR
ncbi:MAG: glycosyltransferase family 2 protein, partial [Solirubrobacterales bacterium]